jgi:hypothetical protein
VVTMAPPGSSRPSLTYTDQTLEALLPAITPCLNFRSGWIADIRSSRRNDASAHGTVIVTDTGFRAIRKRLTVAFANPSRDV